MTASVDRLATPRVTGSSQLRSARLVGWIGQTDGAPLHDERKQKRPCAAGRYMWGMDRILTQLKQSARFFVVSSVDIIVLKGERVVENVSLVIILHTQLAVSA